MARINISIPYFFTAGVGQVRELLLPAEGLMGGMPMTLSLRGQLGGRGEELSSATIVAHWAMGAPHLKVRIRSCDTSYGLWVEVTSFEVTLPAYLAAKVREAWATMAPAMTSTDRGLSFGQRGGDRVHFAFGEAAVLQLRELQDARKVARFQAEQARWAAAATIAQLSDDES
jgi:hypothetical protein